MVGSRKGGNYIRTQKNSSFVLCSIIFLNCIRGFQFLGFLFNALMDTLYITVACTADPLASLKTGFKQFNHLSSYANDNFELFSVKLVLFMYPPLARW